MNSLSYLDFIRALREAKKRGKKIGFTNGCFDILHVGHVDYLAKAKAKCNVLIVAVNGDKSVRQLKGLGRPLNPEADRLKVVSAIGYVSAAFIFRTKRVTKLLEDIRPDYWFKGGDYDLNKIDKGELRAARKAHVKLVIIPAVHDISTSRLIGRS